MEEVYHLTPSKDKSQYLDTLFPELQGKDITKGFRESSNYTKETLAYMSSAKRAKEVAETVVKYLNPKYLIDASAGIGGNTLGFALENSIQKVISYEIKRDRWTMLKNNIREYSLDGKIIAYNSPFGIGEDLQLLDLNDDKIKSSTVVYFDPPWLPSGAPINKANYITSGMKFAEKSIENWGKFLIDTEGYLGVIFHLPPNYNFTLTNTFKIKSHPYTLIIYTKDSQAVSMLNEFIDRNVYNEIKEEVKEGSIDKSIDDELLYNFARDNDAPVVQLNTYLTPEFPKNPPELPFYNPKLISIYRRGILLTDIEFLLRLIKNGNDTKYTVVYLTTTGGFYIPLLTEMFPEIKFDVYGPKFEFKSNEKNLNVFETELDVKNIPEYTDDQNIVLICDFFGNDDKVDSYSTLYFQHIFMDKLKPVRSLMKFHVDDNDLVTEYFDGILNFIPYSNATSNYTRLEIGNSPQLFKINNQDYTKQLKYFHSNYRIKSFTAYDKMYGWTYDTIREFYILYKYVNYRGQGFKNILKYTELFDKLSLDESHKISQIIRKMMN